jgi:hypothetical protein
MNPMRFDTVYGASLHRCNVRSIFIGRDEQVAGEIFNGLNAKQATARMRRGCVAWSGPPQHRRRHRPTPSKTWPSSRGVPEWARRWELKGVRPRAPTPKIAVWRALPRPTSDVAANGALAVIVIGPQVRAQNSSMVGNLTIFGQSRAR